MARINVTVAQAERTLFALASVPVGVDDDLDALREKLRKIANPAPPAPIPGQTDLVEELAACESRS